MSGTGKSSVLRELSRRGFQVVDIDTDAWSEWVVLPDGSRDWIWAEAKMTALLSGHVGRHLFVAGCRTKQGKFYPAFDAVVLLSMSADVLLSRVTSRTNSPYGHDPAEQEEILRYLEEVKPLLRATATAEIDAAAPSRRLWIGCWRWLTHAGQSFSLALPTTRIPRMSGRAALLLRVCLPRAGTPGTGACLTGRAVHAAFFCYHQAAPWSACILLATDGIQPAVGERRRRPRRARRCTTRPRS
ncbi:MAG: AAA family ATPase [Clostridia bacterium]